MDALGPVVEAFGQRHLDGLHDTVAPARFEAGRHRRETHEAANQQPRPDQEHERHRDLPGHQQRPQPLALTVARRARFAGVQREAFAERGSADAERRHEADEQRRDERQAEAERHHARVDHNAAEAWHSELRHERQRDADRDLREHHAERRAEQRQHDRFRQQLTHDPPASRTDGHADGQFAATRGEARHLQVGDVAAGDQQHERHRTEQDQQQSAHRRRALLLQADHARQRADVRREYALGSQCAGWRDRPLVDQRRQFGYRALPRDAWPHAAQQEEERAAAVVTGPAIDQKDVGFRQRADTDHRPEAEVRRQHADDGTGEAVDGDGLPDDRRIGVERRAPQPIADDRGAIVVWRRGAGEERAAARGIDAERVEEIRAHLERGQLQRLAASGELRVDRVVGREMIERADARAQRLVRQRAARSRTSWRPSPVCCADETMTRRSGLGYGSGRQSTP